MKRTILVTVAGLSALVLAVIGVAAAAYGGYTAYLRKTNPAKLGKLEPMKKQFGEKAGGVVHLVAYTAIPLVGGAVLIYAGLAGIKAF